MQKYDYLNRLIKTNCVVVVRGNDAAEAVKTVDAVIFRVWYSDGKWYKIIKI